MWTVPQDGEENDGMGLGAREGGNAELGAETEKGKVSPSKCGATIDGRTRLLSLPAEGDNPNPLRTHSNLGI